MTRVAGFGHPLLLGFEEIERTIDRVVRSSSDGYPPYDIERTGPDTLRITLAVAGFRRDDLDVTVEAGQLTVSGRRSDDDGERVFLHRGIAARRFRRSFVLADGLEVSGAGTADGLLHVDLRRPPPETRVRSVPIASGRPADDASQDDDVQVTRT